MIFAIFISSHFSRVYASAAELKTDKATGFTYDTSGVIWAYEGTATNLVIPAKLGNVIIKKIGSSAFFDNKKLKSVTFPNGLTEIGDNAFGRCTSLTTVKLPSTLKVIDAYAFDSCSKLKGITIPNGVKTIDEGAFLFCSSITEIKIPNSVTTLGTGAFQGVSITSITIPSSITTISGALFGQTLLETVIIPKTIKSIEGEAFAECSKLKSITIPKTVTKIEHGVFDKCPLVTVYGENGSAAQIYCANYNIKFVDIAESTKPSKPEIKSGQIVIPAATKGATVTAVLSKTKIAVNNAAENLVGYTIEGEDYYQITDLASILAGTEKQFSPGYDKVHSVMQLMGDFDIAGKSGSSKEDGMEKQATRVYPTIYYETTEISGSISVYAIDGEDYYKFSDVMNIINCGVIKNKKTGVINLNPKLSYEPLNSPVFAAVPKGNATYQKIQKSLYDAYLKGKDEVIDYSSVTVPDNTVLYVPRGVTYENGTKIYLGNNSGFIVKGEWKAEYPDRVLYPKSANTKNAVYSYAFNPIHAIGEYGANNNIVYVSSKNNFEWGNMPLNSIKISYGNVTNGVQPIILNVTRDKRDSETCLFVYFHVKGGESYGYLYNNVNESVDLSPQLATVVAKNIGKKATIDRINVQNANGISFSKDISLAVDWTITTSGVAPTELKTVNYSDAFYGNNSLVFDGLSKNSYIVKCILDKEAAYQIISPKNNYTVAPLQEEGASDLNIMGDSSNLALFTGKKEKSGKNTYSFVVSPFSNDLYYTLDSNAYPTLATLSLEDKKTYLKFSLNKPEDSSTNYGSSIEIMVKYHKKGDPADVLGLLYADYTDIDESSETGKLDLTPSLTELTNSKGTVNIDSLYVYTYWVRLTDEKKIPSAKFTVAPCDFTPAATDSVKLGKDIVALIQADGLQASTGSTSITAPFKITNRLDNFTSIKISPAGKNQWGPNLLKKDLWLDQAITVEITFNPSSPRYDIKTFTDWGDPEMNMTRIIKGVNLSGVTEAGGSIELGYSWSIDEDVAVVTNNVTPKPIAAGSSGTDTIDVVLIPGSEIKTFNLSDFSLVLDDGPKTPYSETAIKLTSLSQTTGGDAKLTFTRYFDPKRENLPYNQELILVYKGNIVGKVKFTNY
jgi:hypothetical protein